MNVSEKNGSVMSLSQNNVDTMSWTPSYYASRCTRFDGAVQCRGRLLILRLKNIRKPTVLSSSIPRYSPVNSPRHEFVIRDVTILVLIYFDMVGNRAELSGLVRPQARESG